MEYAGFWKRFAAVIVDSIIMAPVGYVVGYIFTMVFLYNIEIDDPYVIELFGNILGIILAWIYHAALESSHLQGTIGKLAIGIKVTDLNGNRINFGQASGRYFAMIISALILGIGFLMAGFTQKKQGLHDMIAGCLVVNKE